MFWPVQMAYAAPEVQQVVQGDVSIDQIQNQTNITASHNSIINYNSFDVAGHEAVNFIQPGATARVLNRVLADNPSLIAGQINANGIVYLTNPAGIIFGGGATVNAAQFYAAAGHMADADFLSGISRFSGLQGDVINQGLINAESIYLMGQNVRNFGTLQGDGEVAMLAGDDVIIGHPLKNISVAIAANSLGQSEVRQSGNIDAGGGNVFLGGGDMAAAAIHHDGITKARNITIDTGRNGTADISGQIKAENKAENTGGNIAVTADTVQVRGATLDASGPQGGGKIEIGGSKKGEGELRNARRTLVDPETKLNASATQNGDGGEVIVWSDSQTAFWGDIEAKGAGIGDGGFAEVSGKYLLAKGNVDLWAPSGKTGTLLYDPIDIQIIGGSADGADSPDGSNTNIAGDSGTNGTVSFADVGTGATPFTIYESEIEATNANIILEAEENISVSGTFGGDELLITPNNDLIMRIRNNINSGSIDLTSSTAGSNLLVRTQGTGSITLEGSTSGTNAGDIRASALQTQTGGININTPNGSIFLTDNLQTDGGDVTITGQTILENNVTIDTELGNDSAAGNVDLQNAIISRVSILESGEVGVVTVPANGGWQTLTFSSSFSNPVVVGTANTNNGNNARVIEVRNVTSTSAQIRVCESDGHISSGCATHPAEDVGYMVFDAADAGAIPGIEAGTFTANNRFDGGGATNVTFGSAFSNTPFVFTTVQTVTGTKFPIETRVTATSTTGFTGGLCFQNSTDACDASKGNENIGWIAIDPDEFVTNLQNEGGSLTVANSQWESVSFGTAFGSTPAVLAEIQTEGGGQDVEIDEVRNVTLSGMDVRTCELDGPNNCDTHAPDTMAWYASEQGAISASVGGSLDIDTTGTTNGTVDLGGFDNAGGAYTQAVDIDAGNGGLVRLHNDVLLDSVASDGARFNVNNGANIALAGDVTISTEMGGDNSGGSLDFTGNTISALTPGADLILDTRGTSDGDVSLGEVSNTVGSYLQSLEIQRGGGTLTLTDNITFDSGGAATGFDVGGSGDIIIQDNVTIVMESGQDEAAGVLDFSQATITSFSAFNSAEAGTFIAPANGTWQTINFGATMTNPVVVATSNTANGGDGRVVEVRNITGGSAEIRLCQSSGPGGGCQPHPTEEVGYLVFDAADAGSITGIDAGTFTANGDFAGGGSQTVNFSETFGSAPLVFMSVQDANATDFPVVARVSSVSSASFNGGICFQTASDSCGTGSGPQSVGWVAIDPAVMPFPTTTDAGSVNISNSSWTGVTFAQTFTSNPVMLVNNQTNNGVQNGEIPEARNVTTLNAQVRYCELDGAGSCDGHTGEQTAWFAIEPFTAINTGLLTIDARGSSGGDIRLGTFDNSGGGFVGNLLVENNGATTTLNGDIDLRNFSGPANVTFNGAGQVRIANDLTITTENGGAADAGDIDFGNNRVSGVTPGLALTLNTSSVGGSGGDVRLHRFDNNGGAEFYVRNVDVQTTGTTDGVLDLFSTVRLNGSGGTPASFTFDGSNVQVSGIAAISTEQTDTGDGGNINLGTAAIYASAPARELTLDASTDFTGAASGLITMGEVSDNSGAGSFLYSLTLDNSADTITTAALSNITLDDNGFGGASSLDLEGAFTLPATRTIIMEQGNDGPAGNIDTTNAEISATVPGTTLTLDATGQTDGDISLGIFSNAGGNNIDTLDLNAANISQTQALATSNLRLQGGTATLSEANSLTTLAANLAGSLTFTSASAFTVGTVLGTNGITTGQGASLTARGDDNLLRVQDSIATNGDTTLIADKLDIGASINTSGNTLNIAPESTTDSGDEIALGVVGDTTANTLELSAMELNFINTSALNIGNNSAGDITVQNAISPLHDPDILLQSGTDVILDDSITTSGDITLAAGQDFFNNAGATALQPGGNYLVYSTSPKNNTRGGLAPAFEEFDKAFPTAPAAANLGTNGFIFESKQILGGGLELTLPPIRTTNTRIEANSEGENIYTACTPGADFVNLDLCEGSEPVRDLDEGVVGISGNIIQGFKGDYWSPFGDNVAEAGNPTQNAN